ncbi:Predicted ATPase related to phosphate starvation-inducible protein PhoH [Olavius algarvensis associated proteobacterium Delta 3]|nr:Predicted ATPase related to phosphate starvation-inducible protein PhoH [Olavius algarvensis associated proteobacterium Delta 3]
MTLEKHYFIDTNVLLDDPGALFKLRNGNENNVYIPYHVLLELNKFKKDPRLGHIVAKVIQHLTENPDQFHVLKANGVAKSLSSLVDNYILEEIEGSGIDNPILVTNDKILQLQAGLSGIPSESYKDSSPFKSVAEHFTGFISDETDLQPNAFMWSGKGKPIFYPPEGARVIDYQNRIWNVTPRTVYQNLALELMIHPDIHVISVQSDAGYGKSFLALATALYLTQQKKTHDKIYMVKPMIEIGQKLGYLPGKIEEKMEPYIRYIADLIIKLHKLRPANRIFAEPDESPPKFDTKRFELLPLTYIRGMNIENAVVIIDEMQNMSRPECRALLSRMGEGVKCICLGDIHQVDHPYLDSENNGLNWVVSKFTGSKIYGHLVLKGDKSRGPITDLVIKSGL